MGTIITIDGPAASGKGTLAARLANHYHLDYLDSGLWYRAVAHKAYLVCCPYSAAARSLEPKDLESPELRSEEVSKATSIAASVPEVREAVNHHLRRAVARSPGSVLDGRDMAFVFPEAGVKIFLTASVEVRAAQRHLQLLKALKEANYDAVLADLRARDKRDAEREASPLRKADDAIEIDSTTLSANQVFYRACEIVASLSVR